MVFQQRFRPCGYLVAQLYGLVMSFLNAFFKVLLSSSSSWLLSAMVNERATVSKSSKLTELNYNSMGGHGGDGLVVGFYGVGGLFQPSQF